MKPVLGILLGDATGIGPEIIAKLCAEGEVTAWCHPILVGDARALKSGMKFADVQFPFSIIKDVNHIDRKGPIPLWDLQNYDPSNHSMGRVSANSGRATGQQFEKALELFNKEIIDGITFAPYNKAALEKGGYNIYKLFARNLKIKWPFGELNLVDNLWISRVTSHIPLREVPDRLNVKRIFGAIKLLHETMVSTGIDQPRIAVASINPHAGEEELFGKEETDIIAPAIASAEQKGIKAKGPFPADTIFVNALKGLYDGVTTMYHDQGQIALKLINFQSAITIVAGLSCPITTPAHGTAFDIAGKGKTNTQAMSRAIEIASKIIKRKIQD